MIRRITYILGTAAGFFTAVDIKETVPLIESKKITN